MTYVIAVLGLTLFSVNQLYAQDYFLIDDFNNPRKAAGFDTGWEGFTDRVMGGRSDMQVRLVPAEVTADDSGPSSHSSRNGLPKPEDGANTLHMQGKVSLENNGGFIQVRLLFDRNRTPFDASSYTGIALTVKGLGDLYYVHLRTPRTVFPWAYYVQKIPVATSWQTVYLPFDDFESENMIANRLNTGKLVSMGIVAAKQESEADLYVKRVELYR